MTATTQWEAVAGVTHAWIAQCEGYVSLCGREVAGFGGQRSGIRCGQCVTSRGWSEHTGESSYLTPPRHMAREMGVTSRTINPRPTKHPTPPPPVCQVVPVAGATISITHEDAIPPLTDDPRPGLQAPETIEAYQALPVAEQRYWAPVMLARDGQEAVWDQAQETAEQFQQHCYERLRHEGH